MGIPKGYPAESGSKGETEGERATAGGCELGIPIDRSTKGTRLFFFEKGH